MFYSFSTIVIVPDDDDDDLKTKWNETKEIQQPAVNLPQWGRKMKKKEKKGR